MGRRRIYQTDEERKAAIKASKAASQIRKRANMTPEQRAKVKEAKTEAQRRRRDAMTPEERAKATADNTEAQRKRRDYTMTHEQQAKVRAANTEAKRRRRDGMTPEERAKATAAHTEAERKGRDYMADEQRGKARAANTEAKRKIRNSLTPEERAKARAAHAEYQRKRKAAMTPEQLEQLRSSHAESERKRKASKCMFEEVRAKTTAKCMMHRKEKQLGVRLTEEEREKMIADYLEARAKKFAAMTEEERNKWRAARSGAKRKRHIYSEMSEEDKKKWNTRYFRRREKCDLVKKMETLDNKTTNYRIERLISLSLDVVTNNPERYETAGTFIKNIFLEIGFLHVELGELKKQLKQIISEAVGNAVKNRNEKERKTELDSSRFMEIPLSLNEGDNTTTFGNVTDPLTFTPGKECHPETPRFSDENNELENQNHEIFEVIAHDSTSDEISKHTSTSKKLECSNCSNKFETSLGLTIHQKGHAVGSTEFNCSICSKVFSTYKLVTTHYLQDHSDVFRININENEHENEETDDELERCTHEMDFLFSSRKCLICFKTLALERVSLATFSQHIIDHHSENKHFLKYFTHICARCDKPHSLMRSLESHWKTICFRKWKHENKNNQEIVCECCGSKFSNKKSLYSHFKIFHSGKKRICEQCGNQFKKENSLKRHIFMVHEAEYKISCEHCGQKFKCQGSLNKHKRTVHLGVKTFVCKFCSRRFASRSALDYHKNTHTGEKPYECKLCDKSFSAKSSLKIHEGSHDGYKCKICGVSLGNYKDLCAHRKLNHYDHNTESHRVSRSSYGASKIHPLPTSCEICGKSVKGFMSLRFHKQQVHGGRKYVCDICGKNYTTYGALRDHKYSHDNLTRFGCNLCGRKFRQATNFYQHRKVAHINENAQIVKLISQTNLSTGATVQRSQRISHLKNVNNLDHALKPDQYSNTKQTSIETPEVTTNCSTNKTETTSPNLRSSMENEDSTGLEDYFSEVEFSDHQQNTLPQFEVLELRNAILENTTKVFVPQDAQNCNLTESIFEKHLAHQSLPSSSFIDYSRANIPSGFAELCGQESITQPTKPNNESVEQSFHQHQVFIEDSEDNAFITDMSSHELVELKTETVGGIVEEDDDVISDLFDSNDCVSENEVQIKIGKTQPGGDSRKVDLKMQAISSPHLVLKLTKLLEYHCQSCDKMIFAQTQRELRQHSRIHRENIPQKKGKYKSKKRKSVPRESDKYVRGLYDCLYCEMKEFKTTTTIIEHCSKEHPGQVPLQCKMCLKMFNTAKRFLDHKSSVHNSALDPQAKSEFLCDICGKNFSTEKDVKWHALRMHQERKFKCDVCPKLFFKMRELEMHKMRHTEKRPHLCDECGKAFFTPHELTDHIERVHKKIERRKQNTKEKSSVTHPFVCNLCPYVFKKESGLKRHQDLHDPKRKYSCDECGLRFILHANVLAHIELKHKKNGKRNIRC